MSQSFATHVFKLSSYILLICDTTQNQGDVYSGKPTIGGFHWWYYVMLINKKSVLRNML